MKCLMIWLQKYIKDLIDLLWFVRFLAAANAFFIEQIDDSIRFYPHNFAMNDIIYNFVV